MGIGWVGDLISGMFATPGPPAEIGPGTVAVSDSPVHTVTISDSPYNTETVMDG